MDKFFTHFIPHEGDVDSMKRLAYSSWFTDTVPIQHYTGVDRIFYTYLEYCVTLGIPAEQRYFDKWLEKELKAVLHRDGAKVRVPGCETLRFEDPVAFETAYRTTVAVMQDGYEELLSYESNIADFRIDATVYFKDRKKELLFQTMSETFERFNNTDDAEDALAYAMDKFNVISYAYSDESLAEIDRAEDSKIQMDFVTDTGLPIIDNDSGGLFTTQLADVEAQPGAGKTRFVLGTFVYRALVEHHRNVCFFALEQTHVEIEAMLVACHTHRMFGIQINDNLILRGKVPPEYQAQVTAARIDLFESGKYGKFHCADIDLYVETFIGRIITLDRLYGPFQLVCIDYMGLLESQPEEYKRALQEYEIIRVGFRQFKRYLRRTRKAGVSISQFNQSGIDAGKKDKEITTDMAQGGMAVFRNTDYNIAIAMTETMKTQNKRRVSQPKVRGTQGFPPFIMDVRLGVLWFGQIAESMV